MDQIEIILRTTDPSGKVTEQLLAKFDTEKTAIEHDKVFQYSGLCIDPVKHQISYQGKVLPLTETYEFQTLVYLANQPGRVFTKEQIYQAVWKEEPVDVSSAVFCSPEAAGGNNKRIYPDCVGSRVQICGCPRGMSPWDVSVENGKL